LTPTRENGEFTAKSHLTTNREEREGTETGGTQGHKVDGGVCTFPYGKGNSIGVAMDVIWSEKRPGLRGLKGGGELFAVRAENPKTLICGRVRMEKQGKAKKTRQAVIGGG